MNYALRVRESDGHLCTIANRGQISTGDNATLTDFTIDAFSQNWTTVNSMTRNEAANEVTVITSGYAGLFDSTVTHEYAARRIKV